MKRLALVISMFWLVTCAPAIAAPRTVNRPASTAARQALRTPTLLANMNKQITVEGFYYDGSIPMIISDMSLLQEDTLLPPDSYVPIVGLRPTGVRWGDRLSVTGVIQRPSANLPSEPAVIRVNAASNFRLVTPATSRFQVNTRFSPAVVQAIQEAMKAPYAVLIAGGANAANNHIRYWNDLAAMYSILRSKGYPADHITVIYADGVAKNASMPVNYSATKANISAAFTNLAARTNDSNDIYIMLNDHGCTLSGGHTGLNLWHEEMSDTEFAAEVNKITKWRNMHIQMKQCFSGGFVDDLTRTKRVVMSSSAAGQVSWAKATLDYGEFTYYYMSALKGSWVDGAAGAPVADASGDGKVSVMEAWNFARSRDTRPETPQYEDNGSAPCQSGGSMPMGGDGPYGAACWLQ